MSEIQNLKRGFIHFLENRGEYFKKVHEGQYRIRCPFCGDTQKNLNEGHLYIKCDLDNDNNIQYNCFKCNQNSGHMTKELLELLGCENEMINNFSKNKKLMKSERKKINEMIYFDYKIPEIRDRSKLHYIEDRLGLLFTDDDFSKMKVIPSLYDFLCTNKIKYRPFNDYILKLLQRDYIGFLTNGNSHILFRDTTEQNEYSWIKYPITEDSMKNRVFYTIKASEGIDVFTQDDITINLSEGVFDALGIAYHFNYMKPNVMNISVSGQQYEAIILYLIKIGVVGKNVEINIFTDNDEMFNKDKRRKSYRSGIPYLKKSLDSYRFLFKRINFYKNTISKDFGVKRNEISLKKEML